MRVILAMIREGANISQTQISRNAGISQGYYSDIECGLRCPSPDVAVRIARVLDIPEGEIFRVFYDEKQRRKKDAV
ncbi:MAG: helix-turn-helix transcriptional regulator [Christensenellales bacterium]